MRATFAADLAWPDRSCGAGHGGQVMSREMCLCATTRWLRCASRIGGAPAQETYMPARSPLHLALSLFAAVGLASLVACAAGAEGTGGDDDPIDARRIDGPVNPNPDASMPTDARLIDAPGQPIDAPISLPDASMGSDAGTLGNACTSSTQCGADAPCCLLGFGTCFPDPGQPILCAP